MTRRFLMMIHMIEAMRSAQQAKIDAMVHCAMSPTGGALDMTGCVTVCGL